ncbi:Uncharacterised protein [Mycobacteroides abscessus subsp. abscessus]|nr:Uncharacterised protein [Mycobacteroides abscessus subsp. abscessus]
MADIGPAAGLGDGKRADQFTGQGWLHVIVDEPLIAGGDHVRGGDPTGEQGGEHTTGHARVVQFLAHDHRVDGIATSAADRFGRAGPEQAQIACLAVQFAREQPLTFPFGDIRQDLALGEITHGLPKCLALGRVPRIHGGHFPSNRDSGMSISRERNHSPMPLAWGSNRA